MTVEARSTVSLMFETRRSWHGTSSTWCHDDGSLILAGSLHNGEKVQPWIRKYPNDFKKDTHSRRNERFSGRSHFSIPVMLENVLGRRNSPRKCRRTFSRFVHQETADFLHTENFLVPMEKTSSSMRRWQHFHFWRYSRWSAILFKTITLRMKRMYKTKKFIQIETEGFNPYAHSPPCTKVTDELIELNNTRNRNQSSNRRSNENHWTPSRVGWRKDEFILSHHMEFRKHHLLLLMDLRTFLQGK